MPVHPNSLANLRPRPWHPGESGNPAGRRPGGAYISEWINALLMTDENGEPKYSQADIRQIAESKTEAPAKVIAARRILSAMRDGGKFLLDRQGKAHPGGTDPEPGKDFDRICDRTEGKPRIRMEVEHSQRSQEEILDRLGALLAANPEIAQRIGAYPAVQSAIACLPPGTLPASDTTSD